MTAVAGFVAGLTAVEHKKFGVGSVLAYANGIARVKFWKKGEDGRFIRSVSVEYMTGSVMAFTPKLSAPLYAPIRRSPGGTAAEHKAGRIASA